MKMVNICTYFSSKESPRQSDFDGIFSVGREVFRLKETMVKVIIQKSCGLISASVVWARNRLHFPYLWDIIYRTDHTQDYYFAPLEKKMQIFSLWVPRVQVLEHAFLLGWDCCLHVLPLDLKASGETHTMDPSFFFYLPSVAAMSPMLECIHLQQMFCAVKYSSGICN